MRTITLILGISGGVICLVNSVDCLFLEDYGKIISIYNAGTFRNLYMLSIPLSILGIFGGLYVRINFSAAAKLLLISSLGNFFLLHFYGCFVGSLLLFIAGILSLFIPNNCYQK